MKRLRPIQMAFLVISLIAGGLGRPRSITIATGCPTTWTPTRRPRMTMPLLLSAPAPCRVGQGQKDPIHLRVWVAQMALAHELPNQAT